MFLNCLACLHVHLQAALAEISRVLAPGGVFVASTFLAAAAPLGQLLGNDDLVRPLNQVIIRPFVFILWLGVQKMYPSRRCILNRCLQPHAWTAEHPPVQAVASHCVAITRKCQCYFWPCLLIVASVHFLGRCRQGSHPPC